MRASGRCAHARSAKGCGDCKNTTSSTGISSSRTRPLVVAFAAFGLWWGAWDASLPAIRRGVDASNGKLGLILLAVGLAALPAMILTGWIYERAGTRLVSIMLVVFAVAGALPAFAPTPLVLFALMLVVGATSGALDVAINVRTVAVESASRVRVLDGMHAAFSAGVVVGGVGTGLLRRGGVHPTAILIAASAVVLATAVANARAEELPSPPRRHAPLARPLLIVGAILAVAFVVESGVENWSALLVENTLHSSPAVSGLGPGLFAAAMVAGRILAQRAAPSSAAARMTIAGSSAAAGALIAALAPHPAVAIFGFVVAGLGLALSAPTLFRLGGRLGAGPAVSTVAVLGYAGFTAGAPMMGGVAAATSLRGAFVFLAVTGVVLVATVPILRRLDTESHG